MFGFAVVLLVAFALLMAFAFSKILFSALSPPLDIIFIIREYTDFASSHLSCARASVKSDEFLQLFSRELAGHGDFPLQFFNQQRKLSYFSCGWAANPADNKSIEFG